MLTLLSPSKSLDFGSFEHNQRTSQPQFLDHARYLVNQLRKLSSAEIGTLMKVSDKIADINHARFKSFATPFNDNNAKPAIYIFSGDVYTGFDARSLKDKAIAFAQNHIRILSGLYGLLRPLDLIQPYRLEMGSRFQVDGKQKLTHYWMQAITDSLNLEIAKQDNPWIINLASHEYFSAVDVQALGGRLVTPIFKERRNGKLKVIAFTAKRLRGAMARFISENEIDHPEALADFSALGYSWNKALSDQNQMMFVKEAS